PTAIGVCSLSLVAECPIDVASSAPGLILKPRASSARTAPCKIRVSMSCGLIDIDHLQIVGPGLWPRQRGARLSRTNHIPIFARGGFEVIVAEDRFVQFRRPADVAINALPHHDLL